MSDRQKTFWMEWSAVFVVHLLVQIAAVMSGAVISIVLALLVSWKIEALAPYTTFLLWSVGIIGGCLGLAILYRFSRFTPRFGRLDFEFEILEHQISYVYRRDKTIEYRRRKKLRALKNGLRVYRDKYHWTGDHPPRKIFSSVAGQTIQLTGRRTVWSTYEINLHRSLQKNAEVETEVVWQLDDTSDTSVPFVSVTVEEPTKSLTFDLSFSTELGVSSVTCEVSTGIGARNTLTSNVLDVGKTGSVSWKPQKPHPMLLHHYEIEWVFPWREEALRHE